MTASPEIFDGYLEINRRLAEHGVPHSSDFWVNHTRDFYLHPTALLAIRCVGRGGAKTHEDIKGSIAESLFGNFNIPSGERHYFAIVSENVDEATKTLVIIKQYLGLLKVDFEAAGDTINIVGEPRGWKVFAARIGATSGFRCFGWAACEQSKWDNGGVNPSEEIIASMNGMTVTHPNARRRQSSSPMGALGHFWESFERGNTKDQIVCQAASWEANPGVTYEHTLSLANGDPRIHAREYGAQFQAGSGSAFDTDAVDAMFREIPPGTQIMRGERVLILDPSSGGANADNFTYAVASWIQSPHVAYRMVEKFSAYGGKHFYDFAEDEKGQKIPLPIAERIKPCIELEDVTAIPGGFWDQKSGDDIVDELVKVARKYGIRAVFSDQRESMMLMSAFNRYGLTFNALPWTSASKPAAVAHVRRLLKERALTTKPNPQLRKEMLGFEEKIAPSGQLTFAGRRGGKDDLVALLITLAMATQQNLFSMTPTSSARKRIIPGYVRA